MSDYIGRTIYKQESKNAESREERKSAEEKAAEGGNRI